MNKILLVLCVMLFVGGVAENAFCAQALKKTVAVTEFENGSDWAGQWRLGNDFSTQLSDALVQSGRFIVLTRENLGHVMLEQDLAQSDRFVKSETAKLGKVIPAQVLIKGKVTEFKEYAQNGKQDLRFHGLSLNTKKSNAHIAVIVQLFNSSTGEIIDSRRVEGEASSTGAIVGAKLGYYNDLSFKSETFKSSALGKAMQIIIDRSVDYITKKLVDVPWSGKVVLVKDKTVYINSGENAGLKKNDAFDIYRPGESLLDPDTGMELGKENIKIGKIKILEVKDKFSTATVLEGDIDQINKGDVII